MMEIRDYSLPASFISISCIASILTAVIFDFIMTAGRKTNRIKRTPIETVTMALFCTGIYLLLRFQAGYIMISNHALSGALTIAGLLLMITGTAFNLTGRINLGRYWSNQIRIYEKQEIVSRGLYKYVRHPLYSSLVMIIIGAAIAYHNWLALLSAITVFLPMMFARARQEEAFLVSNSEDYKIYMKMTGMFLPGIRKREKYGCK